MARAMRRGALGLWLALGLAGCARVPPPHPLVEPELLPPRAATTNPPLPRGRLADRVYPGLAGATLPPVPAAVPAGPPVTLNFADAPLRDVARDVLGGILHQAYTIDPAAHAKITLGSGGPVSRARVLPLLAVALRSSGLALLRSSGVYRIVPLAAATAAGPGAPGAAAAETTRRFPLHYVDAAVLQAALKPLLGSGLAVTAAPQGDALIASGPPDALAHLAAVIAMFDVNWLHRRSFGIFPVQNEPAADMARDLGAVFGAGGKAPGPVRVIALARENMVLVIAASPGLLAAARRWEARLDRRNPDAHRHLYAYRVRNVPATDLARVLSQLLGGGGGGTRSTGPTAPGSTPILVGSQAAGATTAGGLGGGTLSGGTVAGAASGGAASGSAITGAASAAGGSAGGSGLGGLAMASGLLGGGGSGSGDRLEAAGAGQGSGAGTGAAGGIRIVADRKSNTLLFYARPAQYRMVRRLITQLDQVPEQVKIDATIAEVTLNHNLQFGLQFYSKDGSSLFSLSNLASGAVAAVYPGFNYSVTSANQQAIISALAGITHVNVVSSPQVLVLDNQTAYFQVGAQVPVPVAQSQSQLTANAPLVSTIEYRNTGVILQVQPRISSDGLVELTIDQQVSDVAPTTSSSLNAPTFNQRQIASSVVVGDNETVALGGLISTNTNRSRSGIPLLMDIPYLGHLFSTTANSVSRTELVVLLTPHVLRSRFDAQVETAGLQNALTLVAPLVRALPR
ncbi:MAG: type II secretion system secretin GspD [Acetobacteraceae bacterium]